MRTLLLTFALLMAIPAMAQYENLSTEDLVRAMKVPEAMGDEATLREIKREWLGRLSPVELGQFFSNEKSSALESGQFEKARFYQGQIERAGKMEWVRAKFETATSMQNSTQAATYQAELNQMRAEIIALELGESDLAAGSAPKPNRPSGNTIPRAAMSAPKAPAQPRASMEQPRPRSGYSIPAFTVPFVNTLAVPNYTVLGINQYHLGLRNSHLIRLGKAQRIGPRSTTLQEGSFIADVSYGFSAFTDGLFRENELYATAGAGYALHGLRTSFMATLNTGLVNYNVNGDIGGPKTATTTLLPTDLMSVRLGGTYHASAAKASSGSVQWGASLFVEQPLNGNTPTLWFGVSTTLYKQRGG